MAAIIMWLRGYHAGKTGVIPSRPRSLDPTAMRRWRASARVAGSASVYISAMLV
jgi:hypothetical protein